MGSLVTGDPRLGAAFSTSPGKHYAARRANMLISGLFFDFYKALSLTVSTHQPSCRNEHQCFATDFAQKSFHTNPSVACRSDTRLLPPMP
jgi:hypothetical protein